MMNVKSLRIWGTIAVAILVTVSAAAITATEAIKQRQKEMEGVRDGMMALGAIAKKEQPFDASVVKDNAAKIANHLATAAELFPAGSDAGEIQTWSKPEIWSDREPFDKIFENTRQAAIDMQSVTEAKAFPPALGKLGTGCKSCHDLYRIPKQ
jgi:cytochrome c556